MKVYQASKTGKSISVSLPSSGSFCSKCLVPYLRCHVWKAKNQFPFEQSSSLPIEVWNDALFDFSSPNSCLDCLARQGVEQLHASRWIAPPSLLLVISLMDGMRLLVKVLSLLYYLLYVEKATELSIRS